MKTQVDELIEVSKRMLSYENFPSLRGLACQWQGDTAALFFYNNGPFCDDLKSDYCCLAGEIHAQFYPDPEYLNEEVFRLDEPVPLPPSSYWVYKNENPSFSSKHPKISARHKWLLKVASAILKKEKSPSWRGVAVDWVEEEIMLHLYCLLYTSPSPRDGLLSRMPSSA